MAEQDSLPMYIKKRPLDFDPNHILAYLDTLDKRSIEAEIAYDEAKDQVQEVFDYVVNEKQTNANASVAQAKVKATNDERYKKVKQELSSRKKWHLVCKIEAKNAHSYCEGLKQKSINELAISKLTKN